MVAEPKAAFDVRALPGLGWYDNGQAILSGPLRALYQSLDALFIKMAGDAEELLFPVLVPARELAKLDYFRSFPHLATFACALDPDPANLQAFKDGAVIDNGEIKLTQTAPIRDALTPAACYHIYIHLQNGVLGGARRFTTRCQCFRREAYYAPLRRQWCFGMREIVCVGGAAEVKAFLDGYRARVDALQRALGLDAAFSAATDPFFDPRANPKWLAQKLDPVKTELVFHDAAGELAIGSINFHRNFFGETFGITVDGRPAFSGCVAFGLERWVYAIVSRWGAEPANWPRLDSVRP